MFGMLHRVWRYFAFKRAVGSMVAKGAPDPLVAFLRRYPEYGGPVAKYAELGFRFEAWTALLCGCALARARSPQAVPLLRVLLDARPPGAPSSAYQAVPWANLPADYRPDLLACAVAAGDPALALRVYELVPVADLAALKPRPGTRDYFPWVCAAFVRGLVAGYDIHPVTRAARNPAAGVPLAPAEAAGLLARAAEFAAREARYGTGEAKTAAFRAACALYPAAGTKPERAVLRWAADGLAAMTDDDVIRAADLLRRFRLKDWIDPLGAAWHALDGRVRAEYHGTVATRAAVVDRGVATRLEAAAGAVLAALGACTALDPEGARLAADDRALQALSDLIGRHNQEVKKYNELVEEYRRLARAEIGPRPPYGSAAGGPAAPPAPTSQFGTTPAGRALVHRLHESEQRVQEQASEIADRQAGLDRWPAFVLWCVLRQQQTYPSCVRQGAAWGLHVIHGAAGVDALTRGRIHEALAEAVSGPEQRDFRERRVQWLPGQGVDEWAVALHDGLRWVAEVAEGDYARDRPEGLKLAADVPPRDVLGRTVALMCELMPPAVEFLTRYPLRLMGLDDHRQLLGEYLRDGCGVTRWTKYTGEEFVGRVEQRYLRLVDRSGPNSMGIYHRLFRHPQLVLPIIYHEFLHYGGPAGDPGRRIANEAEVVLREVVFARGLIARLAADVADLPAHEAELLAAADGVELAGLVLQWVSDVESDDALADLNAEVLRTYGARVAGPEAEAYVHDAFVREDVNTMFANDTSAGRWCPDVRWPSLWDPGVRGLADEFRRILVTNWTCEHGLTPARRDAVLADPACRAWRDAWAEYLKRPGAGDVFRDVLRQFTALELIRKLIRRFAFEPRPRPFDRGSFATASGVVTFRGTPVDGAEVTFHRTALAGGESGGAFRSLTDGSGEYLVGASGENPGVPAGVYQVTVTKYDGEFPAAVEAAPSGAAGGPTNLLPREYATTATTELSVYLDAGRNVNVDFDLKGE
ncbi:MAG TPA: carboxypeptidase-like regulatory domain-containing protein [Urbifossiella sp.]|nr:carboxypeptidase-like regulatory domain-containing protein [Urbifossiella sp.]